LHGIGPGIVLNEGKYGSVYILLQHDGPETGRHQEQYREEGKNGLMLAVLIILFRANTLVWIFI
jgi:hypothetical protein